MMRRANHAVEEYNSRGKIIRLSKVGRALGCRTPGIYSVKSDKYKYKYKDEDCGTLVFPKVWFLFSEHPL